MRTMRQAGVYSTVRHYLRAVAAAGTVEAGAVMAKMRELPVDDFFARNGRIRADGRLLHDMYFVQVKTPAESKDPGIISKFSRQSLARSRAGACSACPLTAAGFMAAAMASIHPFG
jgi:branched-chain amino acid transport system substrate-binding protein